MRTSEEIIEYVKVTYPKLGATSGVKLCMRIYAEEALDLAAEKADLEYCSIEQGHKEEDWVDIADYTGKWFRIDRNSILKLKDQLK